MGQLEDVLSPLIDVDAFRSIERTMFEDTKLGCLRLLGSCTESLGAFYSIKRITNSNGSFNYVRPTNNLENFRRCLEYMSAAYCKIYDEMNQYVNAEGKHSRNLCKVLRHGTTHEFDPKMTYRIVINQKELSETIGFEFSSFILKINLKEYFRDLKKGYEKWKKEIQDDKLGEKFIGVMHVSGYRFPPQGGISKLETTDGQYTMKFE